MNASDIAPECLLEQTSFQFYVCSSNGECAGASCACEEGWTGRGDFLNHEGVDCHVNEQVVTVLNIVCLLACFGNLCVNLSKLVPDLLRAFVPEYAPVGGASKKVTPEGGGASKMSTSSSSVSSADSDSSPKSPKRTTTSNISKNVLLQKKMGTEVFKLPMIVARCFSAVGSFGWIGMAAQHLTTTRVVGTDMGITISNAVGTCSFWAFVFGCVYTIVSLAVKAGGAKSDELKATVQAYKRRAFCSWLLIVIANLFTVIMAVDNSTQKFLTPAYYVTTTLTINSVQYFVHIYVGKMIKIMKDNDKGAGKMDDQINKFELIRTTVVKRALLQIAMNVAFASWPFLWNKAAYLLPAQWTFANILSTIIMTKVLPAQVVKIKVKSNPT
ncbi:hypothetical protein TeGR_g4267 [Tetraparma gracilis]|uniref:EGF-like domain-containing protein n=1 Tax=Tetraparma gracilis TaxID=2962635 RepID=A0ABQ6N886_9STRA|nr:hypothetical protein TeGR_g4267 [Tetraparma gracilis]